MRVALVHDWVTGLRGGERVLHELAGLFPDADLYTLFHVPGTTTRRIDSLRVRASVLSRLPGSRPHYRKLLPLFPWAIERFRLRGYDLVLSSSHAVAKGVAVEDGAPHLCYCYTPMRYVWDHCETYLGRGLRRAVADPVVRALRRWDVRTAAGVTRFLACSGTVADRIRRHYGRESSVLHPPVDLDTFRPRSGTARGPYLLVGALVPYKRVDLALDAFGRLGRPLLVVGDGPDRARLERRAPSNVRFAGRVSDSELAQVYAGCRALVFPQEEDFGLVALEAQACGRPVIAYGRGGATESVIPVGGEETDAPTGIWFHEQSPDALVEAVRAFERIQGVFDPAAIRAHAERFGVPRFRRAVLAAVRDLVPAVRAEPVPAGVSR